MLFSVMSRDKSRLRRRSFVKTAVPIGIVGMAGCTGNGDGDGTGNGNGNGTGNGNGNGNGDDNGGEQNTYNWRLGTSSQATATHAAGVAFSSTINEHSDMLEASAQTTGGTEANPRLIDEGQIDMGITTGDAVSRANTNGSPYDDPPVDKTFCQTFTFMTVDQFLVRRNTEELQDIETLDDVPTDGSIRMSWGARGSSGFRVQQLAFEIAGIENPTEKYDIRPIEVGDQPAAFREGRLDIAFTYTINHSILPGWAQELDSTSEFSIVKYPFDEQDVIDSGYPLIFSTAEPPFNQEVGVDTFPTVSLTYTPTIPAGVSEEAGYEFTSILMENHEEVSEAHAVLSNFNPESGTNLLLASEEAPIHPGAEQYYRDNDLWSDEFTSLDDY